MRLISFFLSLVFFTEVLPAAAAEQNRLRYDEKTGKCLNSKGEPSLPVESYFGSCGKSKGLYQEGLKVKELDLRGSHLVRVTLDRAEIGTLYLDGSVFYRFTIKNSKIGRIILNGTHGRELSILTSEIDKLEGGQKKKSQLVYCDFDQIQIKTAQLNETSLVGCLFIGSSIQQGEITRHGARMFNVGNHYRYVHQTEHLAPVFDGAKLPKFHFKNVFFYRASFKFADLSGATFENFDCRSCSFQGANLRDATFKDTSLSSVEFGLADLRGADLRGMKVEKDEILLNFAKYDKKTKFPWKGSDLEKKKKNMTYVED